MEIMEYLKTKKLIELQLVGGGKYRGFYAFAQSLISHLTIFRCRGIYLMESMEESTLNILTMNANRYVWKTLDVTDKESDEVVDDLFCGGLVQTNCEEVYFSNYRAFY